MDVLDGLYASALAGPKSYGNSLKIVPSYVELPPE